MDEGTGARVKIINLACLSILGLSCSSNQLISQKTDYGTSTKL